MPSEKKLCGITWPLEMCSVSPARHCLNRSSHSQGLCPSRTFSRTNEAVDDEEDLQKSCWSPPLGRAEDTCKNGRPPSRHSPFQSHDFYEDAPEEQEALQQVEPTVEAESERSDDEVCEFQELQALKYLPGTPRTSFRENTREVTCADLPGCCVLPIVVKAISSLSASFRSNASAIYERSISEKFRLRKDEDEMLALQAHEVQRRPVEKDRRRVEAETISEGFLQKLRQQGIDRSGNSSSSDHRHSEEDGSANQNQQETAIESRQAVEEELPDVQPPSLLGSFFSSRKSKTTHVDDTRFRLDEENLRKTGGTAAFRKLFLRDPDRECKSPTYFVGKDLSHAPEEKRFYEDVLKFRKQGGQSALHDIVAFMFEYEGVLTTPSGTELLVLRNLNDGFRSMRMVDIKIGKKTAIPGWKGKSPWRARLQNKLEAVTNAGHQGFRLAGFDGPPPSFDTRDPVVGFGRLFAFFSRKKPFQLKHARRTGLSILAFVFDFHQVPTEDAEQVTTGKALAPSEMAEILMHEVVKKLVFFWKACTRVSVPQQWIGSSIAIAFDCGDLPYRKQAEALLRDGVRLNIFDWGRSEFNTAETHACLPEEEKKDRQKYWDLYVAGVHQLAGDALHAYLNRFGNSTSWSTVTATVWDYDASKRPDYMGRIDINLQEADGQKERTEILDVGHLFSSHLIEKPTLTYSVELRHFPCDSRLLMAWRICFHHAENLEMKDFWSRSSDAYVELIAVAENGREFRQRSSVCMRTLNPVWNETFEIPVARRRGDESLGQDLEAAEIERLGRSAARRHRLHSTNTDTF